MRQVKRKTLAVFVFFAIVIGTPLLLSQRLSAKTASQNYAGRDTIKNNIRDINTESRREWGLLSKDTVNHDSLLPPSVEDTNSIQIQEKLQPIDREVVGNSLNSIEKKRYPDYDVPMKKSNADMMPMVDTRQEKLIPVKLNIDTIKNDTIKSEYPSLITSKIDVKSPIVNWTTSTTANQTYTTTVTEPLPGKVKQWETYDYESPYNLLEIHVDRAPQHNEGQGTPWPMPQEYLTTEVTIPIDMEAFKIFQPVGACGRVTRAIKRYNKLISSKADLFIPDGRSYLPPSNSASLKELTVKLTRGCNDNDIPHEHMSEQYKLRIDDKGAQLSAPELWGVIRGLETFSQLIYFNGRHAVVNTTYIKDYPRFTFRGLMLDTARHFIPISTIKRTLDAMSYSKLNVFHWHIVDDQSFPYISKTFPDLSAKGAYSRKETYSAKDIQKLIEYAADRAIRIVPEFDSPGHTRSWGLGYPKLLTKCSDAYHPFGAVNPLSNYTYEFMGALWREIHDLFPDSTVHVGGDEINYKCWLRLKEFREYMLKHDMITDQYDVAKLDGDKLQGYYLKRLLDVMPKDRKKIAWQEAFNAAQLWNLSTDHLIINVWKGGDYEWQYTMESVVRKGYKAILSAPWYLNYISYGRDWTKYYEQDPHNFLMYSAGGADAFKDYVLGGQVCMWAEFIDESNLEPTLWPRASSPAEKLWSSSQMVDWKKAEVRFENHRCRMSRRGIRTQPNSGPGSCTGTMKIKPPYDAENQM